MKKILPKVFTDYEKFLQVTGCEYEDNKDFDACYCVGYIWVRNLNFSHFVHEIIHHLFYLFFFDFDALNDTWDNIWIDLFRRPKKVIKNE